VSVNEFDHDRQSFNTRLPPSDQSVVAAVYFVRRTFDCIYSEIQLTVFHAWMDLRGYQYVILRQTSIVDIGGTSATVE